jgi:hypothetical protein
MSKFRTQNDGEGVVLKFVAGMPGGLAIQKDAGEEELGWEESVSDLSKSAASTDLTALRVQVKNQIDELLKRINGLIEQRKATRPAKFQTSGVEKVDAAAAELKKALANGKPVTFQPSEGGASRFQTAEAVAPGVQRFSKASDGDGNFHGTPGNALTASRAVEKASIASSGERRAFQPDGETDLNKADAAVRHALANGQRV